MNQPLSPDIQQSIQQSLQDIGLQMGKPLTQIEVEQLYRDAADLLSQIVYEPLTLARVAGTLLVYEVQETEAEEIEWFRSQVQQCLDDEAVEELIESMHRTDAL